MMITAIGGAVFLAGFPSGVAGAQTSGDWSAYLDNTARTGYNSAEATISASTAPNLKQLWTDGNGGAVSAEPVTSGGVAFYGSWDGYERAANAATGAKLWSTYLGQTTDSSCEPPTVGVASTAAVGSITTNGTATRAVFVGGGDGNFYALNASTGGVIWKARLGTPPAYFLWSSPVFYKGSIYEGLSSFGDCPLIRGGIVQMNAITGAVRKTFYTAPAGCTGASVWGSPTVDTATGDIYFGTGNAGSCGSPETLASAVIQTDSSLSLLSTWQVPGNQQIKDGDFGSTPTLFHAYMSGVLHQMVGLPNKNGVYYAFDRSSLSSGPLWQRRTSYGGACPECGESDISSSAYDGHHLFVGGEKGKVKEALCAGNIKELRPSTGGIVWADCLQSGPVIGAVTGVPGVVFVGAGNTVYAVNMNNGAILWTYQDTLTGSNFWGPAAISNGIAYIGNQDGNLYAFGT